MAERFMRINCRRFGVPLLRSVCGWTELAAFYGSPRLAEARRGLSEDAREACRRGDE
ncbi:protein of unknown function [Burkholderia multivorans]